MHETLDRIREVYTKSSDKRLWWRGHAVASWHLHPSIYHKGLAGEETNLIARFKQSAVALDPQLSGSTSLAKSDLTIRGTQKLAGATYDTFVRPMFNFVAANDRDVVEGLSERHRRFLQGVTEFIEEGKRDGSVRRDVDSREIACRILMFAWAQDVARLVGLDDLVESGVTTRAYRKLIGGIATVQAVDRCTDVLPSSEDGQESADKEATPQRLGQVDTGTYTG